MQWVRRELVPGRDRAGSWKHPRELGAAEVVAFLDHLATPEHVAAATPNQALNAMAFLNREGLAAPMVAGDFVRVKTRWPWLWATLNPGAGCSRRAFADEPRLALDCNLDFQISSLNPKLKGQWPLAFSRC